MSLLIEESSALDKELESLLVEDGSRLMESAIGDGYKCG